MPKPITVDIADCEEYLPLTQDPATLLPKCDPSNVSDWVCGAVAASAS